MGPRRFELRSPAPKAGILNQVILGTLKKIYRGRLFKLIYNYGIVGGEVDADFPKTSSPTPTDAFIRVGKRK